MEVGFFLSDAYAACFKAEVDLDGALLKPWSAAFILLQVDETTDAALFPGSLGHGDTGSAGDAGVGAGLGCVRGAAE